MRRLCAPILTFTCTFTLACPGVETGSDMALPLDQAVADMAGCPTNKPPAVTIMVRDDYYEPKEATIPVCGKVRWQFQASGSHGVFPWDMGFPEGPVLSTGTYEYVFPKAGIFDYGCAIHGRNMPGKITVQ